MRSTVILWGGALLLGCGDVPPSPAAKLDPESAQTVVACRATLTAFDANYRWFDDSHLGHDDGVAPMASLELLQPAAYAGRTLNILFKYSSKTVTTMPPDETDIGSNFSVELPMDFLNGRSNTIDNLNVGHLSKMEP